MARILIVDDEESVLMLMSEILQQNRHEIILARTGSEGIEKYKVSEFDLVITDLVMPEKSGLDLIMELRKINPGIKVIAISGGGGIHGRFDYLPIAKLVGAIKVIKKPFQINEIKAAVNNLL